MIVNTKYTGTPYKFEYEPLPENTQMEIATLYAMMRAELKTGVSTLLTLFLVEASTYEYGFTQSRITKSGIFSAEQCGNVVKRLKRGGYIDKEETSERKTIYFLTPKGVKTVRDFQTEFQEQLVHFKKVINANRNRIWNQISNPRTNKIPSRRRVEPAEAQTKIQPGYDPNDF